jgi:anion-transporting  ArsA/GET3 family ATPase
MTSPLERKLLVVTGKGGVGKSTVAAAVGLQAAERGARTIVVEVGDQARLPELFGMSQAGGGAEIELERDLWSISIDPDRALLEWLQKLGGRVSGRVLASSSTFQYFAAAAPGAKELVSMVKIWELTQGRRWRRGAAPYDLVVIDGPATGHALGMLRSPSTFGAIARVGPIAGQSEQVRELLADPARSGFMAVAQATDMAVSETLELRDDLHEHIGRALDTVVVNGILPQRFTAAELGRIAKLNGSSRQADRATAKSTRGRHRASDGDAVMRSAAQAARAVHDRARLQHNQLARLRRRGFEVLGVPFVFAAELDLAAVRRIAEQLGRKL